MNITGEYADYINNILVQFAPADVDDVRGIINDGTLYFIVNFGMLYEIELPNIPRNITCAFFRQKDVPASFANPGVIIDLPDFFPDVVNRLMVIGLANGDPVYIDDNVREDEQYTKIENMRPGDGALKFNINTNLNYKSFVTLSKKMFKLNKSDTLALEVYKPDPARLLFKFKIYKKKFNLNINLYLLTLDLH